MSALNPLPLEISTALSRWQALRKGASWSKATASQVREGLLTATRAASDANRAPLSRAIGDLAHYLSDIVDTDLPAPTPTQWQQLASLERATLSLLREERAEVVVALRRKRIVVLAPPVALWTTLLERLSTYQYRIEHHSNARQLLSLLNPVDLAAVVVDQEFLGDLGAVADQVEAARRADSLSATVVFCNRGRDLATRSLALRRGADATLDGEDLDSLVARLQELLAARDSNENLRVLLVEDDRSQVMYCEAILRKQGIHVRVLGDARAVLEEIASFAPDLVLMDLHMPDIDGMQLTTLIRDNPDMSLLPIVFLTGEQDEGTRYDALRAGGDDFLVKPVRPAHLVTAVVTRARRARALRHQFKRRLAPRESRLVLPGELVAQLRLFGMDGSCNHALLLAAADSGRLCAEKTHRAVELEKQLVIARRLQANLADGESVAPWHDGAFLMLIEKSLDADLMQRAESIRAAITTELRDSGGGSVSVAVLPLPDESLPPAETLVELAEHTLAVVRHTGGGRVKRALSAAHTDLAADVSLAAQKALELEPSEANVCLQYQAIVALHGGARPQYHQHLGLRIAMGEERVITRRQWLSLGQQSARVLHFDLYAVGRALEQIERLRPRLGGLRIIVAVDGESLLDPGFLYAVRHEIARLRLDDPGLVLGIDQSEALLLRKRLLKVRKQLAELHIGLCLGRTATDGTGKDALAELRPELVAVDAAALRAPGAAPPIMEAARACGAEVIAHFIHDAHTLARLFALGVEYGMGNFVGAPAPRLEYDFGHHAG